MSRARTPRRGGSTRLDPAVPMLVFAVAVAISPEFEFLGVSKVRVSDLLLPVLLMIFAGRAATGSSKEPWRSRDPIPLLPWMGAVLAWDLSAWWLFSEDSPRSLGLMYLAKRAEFFLIYLLGVQVITSRASWERITNLFLVAAPILNLSVLWELNRSQVHFRASGIIKGQETSTALFIVVVMGLVFGLWPIYSRLKRTLPLLLAATSGGAALLATGSRAGILCAAVVIGLLVGRERKNHLAMLAALALVMASSWTLLPDRLQERFERVPTEITESWRGLVEDPSLMPSAGSSSIAARLQIGQRVLNELIPRAPLTGLGTARLQLGLIDNFFLTEWVYHGLIGVTLFSFLLYQLSRELRAVIRSSRDPMQASVAAGLQAVLAALLVSCLAAETFYLIRPMEGFFLLVGMSVGRARLDTLRQGPEGSPLA